MIDMKTNKNKRISNKPTDSFTMVHQETILNKAEFNRFLNWVSAEYELYLQDNEKGLTVYFPGICLQIFEKSYENNLLNFEINIKSKYEKNGVQVSRQVLSLLNHLKHFIC